MSGGRSNDPHTIQLRFIPANIRLAPLHEYESIKNRASGGQRNIARNRNKKAIIENDPESAPCE